MSVELDDQVAANLGAAAKLLDQLQKNPETRKPLLQMVKKVNPQISIPELDAVEPLNSALDGLGKKIDTLATSITQKEQDAKLSAERQRLRDKHGFTDEGIKTLEAYMIETGTTSHEVARKAMAADKPEAQPARPSYNMRAQFHASEEDEKGWLSDPEKQLDVELNRAFDAIAAGQAA